MRLKKLNYRVLLYFDNYPGVENLFLEILNFILKGIQAFDIILFGTVYQVLVSKIRSKTQQFYRLYRKRDQFKFLPLWIGLFFLMA